MDDRKLLEEMTHPRGPRVLATVIATRGSTPRKTGAKMIVDPSGGVTGTIGGGCGEGEVIEAAMELFSGSGPRVVQVDLTDEIMSWSPAVCGGVMDVFIERVGDLGIVPGEAAMEPGREDPEP